ncbi:MAG: hypothetical protein JO271_09575 [Verrucomicrobia bacterium]|nr:hypothetical protein [Verrucomicrobiota bacterium]MBV9274824.1 hypothetical protein [Verrucomicrobiota bacterium]
MRGTLAYPRPSGLLLSSVLPGRYQARAVVVQLDQTGIDFIENGLRKSAISHWLVVESGPKRFGTVAR